MAAVPRKPGPLTPSNTRGVFVLQLSRKDVRQRAACSRGTLASVVFWTVADGSCLGRRYRICHHDAQPFQFLGSVEKAFFRRHLCGHSVLVEEVVVPVMGRSDRAKVMARLGWTESERHRFEAALQGRQNETALLGMAPDVAAMLADWHQTNWFTVQGAEKQAIHSTGGSSW